jgi:siroheme synthase
MGLARVRPIVAALLAGGMSPDTPAAAVESGTLPEEKRVIARLARLPEDVERAGIASPALLVIGKVVGLAREATAKSAHRVAA